MTTIKRKFAFFPVLLSSLLLLTACSSSTQSSDAPKTPAPPTEITIKHAMGESKVSSTPKKIVVLDNGSLDNLIALGVKPVGAATVALDSPIPTYLKDTTGITNIGTIDQPNLEAIAALQPDVILGSKDTHEKIYDKLKQIAPTVFVESLGATWKDNFKLEAEAIGQKAKGDELLATYKKRTEEFKTKMGDSLKTTTVSLLRPRKDNVTAYYKATFAGSILQDMGLPRPEAQNKDTFSEKLNEEGVANMAGDAIFWFTRDKENLLTSKIVNMPTWQELKAVKEKKVFEVNSDIWLSGLGYNAANLVVDDLSKNLVK